MKTRHELTEALNNVAKNLSADELQDIQLYAESLITKRTRQDSFLSNPEPALQDNHNTSLLITYILQRSRLVSLVNHLANLILHAENMSSDDRLEA